MSVLVTTLVAVLLALWALALYNRLVRLKNQVRNAWSQIDVQLKRRHDLIPALVDTIRSAMNFEKETLEAVVAARQRAVAAKGPVDAARKERVLTESLGRCMAVVEGYPQLTTNQNVRELQAQLARVEGDIASARETYNTTATAYNTSVDVVPNNIVAGLGSFPKAELFQASDNERMVPRATSS
jgi:LemA protein